MSDLRATVSIRISLGPGSWLIIKLEAGCQDLSDTRARTVCLPFKIAPHDQTDYYSYVN